MPVRPSLQEIRWLSSAAKSPAQFRSFLRRSFRGEPLAVGLSVSSGFVHSGLIYIHTSTVVLTGSQPFHELHLRVHQPVLIPRPETEEWAIRLSELLVPSKLALSRPLSILDLGTGTGCIPLLLCHVWRPKGQVRAHGIDINPAAVELANENGAACGLSPDTFKAVQGNFLAPNFPGNLPENIAPPFDIVTSNPPYIPLDEYRELPASVARYEDRGALLGGPTGLEFYRAIARLTAKKGFLSPGAVVALEIGYNQADAVRNIMHASGFNTQVWVDAWGKERTIIARRFVRVG
ncbi:hypothetical protein V5O48_003244 [Marasmius crinis-equi]|uniref:Methyltransferase domain-containing protein n=1 Tax=Marasmius crinis-equi TaxID=585013 RepID=A0ABR3FTT9_9AGAR